MSSATEGSPQAAELQSTMLNGTLFFVLRRKCWPTALTGGIKQHFVLSGPEAGNVISEDTLQHLNSPLLMRKFLWRTCDRRVPHLWRFIGAVYHLAKEVQTPHQRYLRRENNFFQARKACLQIQPVFRGRSRLSLCKNYLGRHRMRFLAVVFHQLSFRKASRLRVFERAGSAKNQRPAGSIMLFDSSIDTLRSECMQLTPFIYLIAKHDNSFCYPRSMHRYSIP